MNILKLMNGMQGNIKHLTLNGEFNTSDRAIEIDFKLTEFGYELNNPKLNQLEIIDLWKGMNGVWNFKVKDRDEFLKLMNENQKNNFYYKD